VETSHDASVDFNVLLRLLFPLFLVQI